MSKRNKNTGETLKNTKLIKVPPRYSELKKEAVKIQDDKRRLLYWIDELRKYQTEESWTMKEVEVIQKKNFILTDEWERLMDKQKKTGKDVNIRSMEAEINKLKTIVDLPEKDNINSIKQGDELNKKRKKYHSDNFWNTTFDLYYSVDYLNTKGAVYDYIKEDMDKLGLEMPYKKSSFKQIWKDENKKRAGGNNVTGKQ